ncbi:MAG: hypothetical protein JWM16_5755 [Verrucomicrobiales bacterium]|nr:hypothetical protein [Verrucomicrobiales bacterium]
MKPILFVLLTAAALVGCDKQKSAIEDHKEATKDALDNRKDAVNAAAKDAKSLYGN